MKSLIQYINEKLIINKEFKGDSFLNELNEIINKEIIVRHEINKPERYNTYTCASNTFTLLRSFIEKYGKLDSTACSFEKIEPGRWRCERRYRNKSLVIIKTKRGASRDNEMYRDVTIIQADKFIYLDNISDFLFIHYESINANGIYIDYDTYEYTYYVFDHDLIDEIDNLLN